MRILILGGNGMLGHRLFKHLKIDHDVRVTLRQDFSIYTGLGMGIFNTQNAYTGVDMRHTDRLLEVLASFRPEAVINAVGIVKQRASSKEYIPSLEINALFPHRLSLFCKAIGARLIHMSTDCIFSGGKGNYKETDLSDTQDLYGKSKFMGEVQENHCVTLRTSIIGRELSHKRGLVEWFLAQNEAVRGFKNAIFSGFTTIEMSRVIEKILVESPQASGLYHVSSDPISKFDLLTLIKQKMEFGIEIIPDETFQCDRSLDSARFRKEFDYTPPTWEAMIEEFSKDFIGETP